MRLRQLIHSIYSNLWLVPVRQRLSAAQSNDQQLTLADPAA
jgi:hypothetical protein